MWLGGIFFFLGGFLFLWFQFIAEHLPDWVDALVVGATMWILFGEVIPATARGVFRRKE